MNPAGLTPHGFCLSWAPGLIATHVVSDTVIGLSYFSIPLAIAAFVRQRADLKYGWVAYLFVGFILACGLTHMWSILTLWFPAYGVEGLIKAITALLSVATAVTLWPLIPKLLLVPSSTQLARLNDELTLQVDEHARTATRLRESEASAQSANLNLELRVAERTAELEDINYLLSVALQDRAEAVEALALSEAQFRASFERAAVGKVHIEPATGKIIRANGAFARMLDYNSEELVGRDGWDFTFADDRPLDKADYESTLNGEKEVYLREKRYVRRGGELVWGRVSATMVRSPETGDPTLAIAVVENIDAEYKAKVALETAKTDLELMLAERTAALSQRDLLLREVYHRVKNNLQIIDSLLVMQGRNLADPDAKAALKGLRSRVFALGLVHHQLMGSHDLKTFNIAPFLTELSENVLQGGASRGVTLSVHAAPLTVGLDFSIPLGLIVTELVTNCLKHAFATGEGAIVVSLDRSNDGEIILVVSDNGLGALSEKQGAIAPTSLGTTIIEGLVQQLGGRLTVTRDRGTRSEIRLTRPVIT